MAFKPPSAIASTTLISFSASAIRTTAIAPCRISSLVISVLLVTGCTEGRESRKGSLCLCRSDYEIPESARAKIALFCDVKPDAVIPLETANNIYEVPITLEEAQFGNLVIESLALQALSTDLVDWRVMVRKMNVGLEPLNQTLAWAVENGVVDDADWERAAVYYLQHFEQRWSTWVTDEAYAQIRDALNAASITSSPSPAGARSG